MNTLQIYMHIINTKQCEHLIFFFFRLYRMTILGVGSFNTLGLSGTAAGATAAATVGSCLGLAGKLINTGPAATLGGVVGAGLSAGAVLGSSINVLTGGSVPIVSSALVGGIHGAWSSMVGSAVIAEIVSGPLGWLVVGCEGAASFDCWKPVLHDWTQEPSSGLPLRDLVRDPRILRVGMLDNQLVVVENVWREQFYLDPVKLPGWGGLALHAKRL